MRFVCLILIFLFLSCNKSDSIKIENVLNRKDSTLEVSQNETKNDYRDEVKNKKRITTSEAAINIGKEVILIGVVAQVTKRNKVSYLNFDYKYPKHTFTGVIFAGDYGKFGDLSVYEGKDVELTGMITEYNGKPQMIINSPEQIKILK